MIRNHKISVYGYAISKSLIIYTQSPTKMLAGFHNSELAPRLAQESRLLDRPTLQPAMDLRQQLLMMTSDN